MMMSTAPGKLILAGEHAVVYGEPAVVAAVQLRTEVGINKSKVGGVGFETNRYSVDELRNYWIEAKSEWQEFDKTNNAQILRKYHNKLALIRLAVGAALERVRYDEGENGLELQLSTDLPIGAGLGSSASLAASIVGAILSIKAEDVSAELVNELTYSLERMMNGRPSGVDNTAVVYGGVMRFQKKMFDNTFEHKSLKLVGTIEECFIVDTGKPEESTAEMVALVKEKIQNEPVKYKKIIKLVGECATEMGEKIEMGRFDPTILSRNQRLLEQLGVVGNRAQRIVDQIEEMGGYAKVCGAGGVKGGSGVIVVYHEDAGKMREWFKKNKLKYFQDHLGGEGWRIEK